MGYSARRLVEVFKTRNGLTPAIARQLAAAGPRAMDAARPVEPVVRVS